MKALKVFLLGLMYGWVVKFIIDRIYRDYEIVDIRNENAALKQYIHSLEKQVQQKPLEPQSPGPGIALLNPAQTVAGKDDLKLIKGIGPAAEKKLNEAGINTFDALAQLTAGELQNILGGSRRVGQSAGDVISQAKELARG